MTAPRRFIPLVVLVVFAVACTGSGGGTPTPTPTASPTSPVPTGPVRFEPGHYRYDFGGVTADITFDGSSATMDVKNATGAELDAPAVYVIDGTGTQRDGTVVDSTSIPDGQTATFAVTFPDQVTKESIGLVVLLFGDSNWGDFAPVPAA